MYDLVSEKFGIKIKFNSKFEDLTTKLIDQNIDFEAKTVGLLVFELFENFIEKEIKDPTFVVDYPVEVSPFAREKKDQQGELIDLSYLLLEVNLPMDFLN
jgi:lysyl-tRNA synthetase class 2